MTLSDIRPEPGPSVVDRRGEVPGRNAIAAVLLLAVLLAVPLVFVVAPLLSRPSGTTPDGVVVALQSVVVAYAATRLAQLGLHNRPRWMSLIFWGFTYVWIGVAGLAQVLADRNPLQTAIPGQVALIQVSIILGGMVAFDVATRYGSRAAGSVPEGSERVVSPRRVYLLAAVSILTAPLLVAILGGVGTFFENRQTVSDTLTQSGLYSGESNASGGTLLVVANTFAFVPLLCMLAMAYRDRTLLRDPRFLVLSALLLVVNAVFNNPLSNARYWFFTVALGLLFCWLGRRGKPMIAGVVAAFVVGGLLLFPVLNVFRYDTYKSQSYLPDLLLTSTDYGTVTDIGLIVRYVERHGYSNGEQLLGTAGFFVPRSLWPDKPDNTYLLVAEDTNFPNLNLDSALWAEGYVDFGFVGALGYLTVLGLVVGGLERRYLDQRLRSAAGVPVTVVLLPAVAAYLPIVLRGSLLQAMARLAALVVLLLLMGRSARRNELSASARKPSTSTATVSASPPR